MKNHYAKQFQPEVKVHVFKSMRERDAWVQKHYDALGARHCSAVEARKLANPKDFILQPVNLNAQPPVTPNSP